MQRPKDPTMQPLRLGQQSMPLLPQRPLVPSLCMAAGASRRKQLGTVGPHRQRQIRIVRVAVRHQRSLRCVLHSQLLVRGPDDEWRGMAIMDQREHGTQPESFHLEHDHSRAAQEDEIARESQFVP